jgi:hypothetical protein
MTVAEWLSAPIRQLVQPLMDSQHQRRLRLFSCGVCRHYQHLITHERVRKALDRAERFAEGELSDATMEKWHLEVRKITEEPTRKRLPEEGINRAVQWACLPSRYGGYPESWSALVWQFRHVQKDEVRAEEVELVARTMLGDIYGHRFRPCSIEPGWLAWNGGTVPKFAQGIYEERAFDRLPILADALEDAGCVDGDILNHCRGPGPHVRGCWVIDLILGKQ